MKNILSILVVSVLIFGCSKSKDNINDNSGSILGTWDFKEYHQIQNRMYIDPVYGTDVLINTESYIENYPSDTDYSRSYTFRYDNTYIDRNWNTDSLGIYTYDNSSIKNYEKKGDSLFLENYSDTSIFLINNLNNSSLSIQLDWIYEWSWNDTLYKIQGTDVYDLTKSFEDDD